ncbi:MAG: hypothetical protein MUC95_10740 [Spirochaetes bacterium]|nr:hypothetical protein [Spirochaetota bacterium]
MYKKRSKIRKLIYMLALFLIIYYGRQYCGSSLKPDPYYNNLARFLAGMPVEDIEKSGLKQLTLTKAYTSHSKAMNKLWEQVQNENISNIDKWRDSQLENKNEKATAFYPCSGADLVNLYSFFPKAGQYIMIALEEPGIIPDPAKLKETELAAGLTAIQRCIETIASRNYLLSRLMRTEMPNKYLPGVTPVLLIFSARLGFNITRVELVGMTSKGDIEKLDDKNAANPLKHVCRGVRINFFAKGDSDERSILYFNLYLSGKTLSETTPEGLFFKDKSRFNTLIKSAVYLLHMPEFKDLCTDILSRSSIIIQDDSGIPFRFFLNDKWNLNYFGYYKYPQPLITIPNPPYQPDLAEKFKNSAQPLAFNFGYGVLAGKNRSNLLLAIKAN